jgi:hypothetical protein
VSLIVAAEQLVIYVREASTLGGLSNHQQQMAVLWLNIDNLDISLGVRLDIEELTVTVMANVDPQWSRRLLPAVLDQRSNFCPSTQLIELGFD